jgi:hypothetical protein
MVSPLGRFIEGRQAGEQAAFQRTQREQTTQEQGIDKKLKEATLLKNSIGAIRNASSDPAQRLQIAQRLAPELQQLGVNIRPDTFTVEQFTDQGLGSMEASLTGFISNPEQALSAAQREFQTLTQGLSEEDKKRARRIKLRLDPGAGVTTGQERIATDPTLTTQVAESQQEIKAAEERGKGEGKSVARVIDESFDKIGRAQANIRNIDRAVSALDKGANTGAVQQFLPSITAASKELEQVRSELGLDVIGDVTFGALSKGELDLALETALPTGLDEPQLKDWLLRKKEAQSKLINNLDQAIQFFEDGGTLGEWRAFLRGQQGAPSDPVQPQEPQGQILRFDAQGNLIQ